MAVDHAEPTTYGGWHKAKGIGIGAIGTGGTILLFGDLIVAVLVALLTDSMVAAFATGIVGLAVVGAVSLPDAAGRTRAQRAAARAGHWRARVTGATSYRSGALARAGTHRLPGLAARSELVDAHDVLGRPFALIRHDAPKCDTVVISAEPDGASLVDADQMDRWVAFYGHWLANLGRELELLAVSVTVEIAPDIGSRLRREVAANIDPGSPEIARDIMREIVDTYPAGAAVVRIYVALTYDARTGKRVRSIEEATRRLANRVHLLAASLENTGAGSARPVSAAGLCELVRTAYDPAAAVGFDEARDAGQPVEADWTNAGPVAAEASWDSYRHDSGVSCTWEMVAAPRGAVLSSVLGPLLQPHADIDRKRVTLLYRPETEGNAARIAERDRDRAKSRVTGAQKPKARDEAIRDAADNTAREIAQGAGLVHVALLTTATVLTLVPSKLRGAL